MKTSQAHKIPLYAVANSEASKDGHCNSKNIIDYDKYDDGGTDNDHDGVDSGESNEKPHAHCTQAHRQQNRRQSFTNSI